MSEDITTDTTLGGRFTSKVTPSRWMDGYYDICVTDTQTGEEATGFLKGLDGRAATQEQLATQLLEQHVVENTEPDVERFSLPAAEEANEVNDSPAEDAAEGE